MQTEIFAKDKPGLSDALDHVREFTEQVTVHTGCVGDGFPQLAEDWRCDLLISYMSPWIIPKAILDRAARYAINFHPGPPEYPGIGCTNFALYNNEKEFGVTAHIMEPRVDSGRIIAVRRFPIESEETVYTLTQKCYSHIFSMFHEVIGNIFAGREIFTTDAAWTREPYTRRELNELCRITPEMDAREVARRVKATTYPNQPGAFIDIANFRFAFEGALGTEEVAHV